MQSAQGNNLPAFTLITKTSVVEVWPRFVTGVESPHHCPARPTVEERSNRRLRLLSQLRGPYVWALRFLLNTRYRRCRRHLNRSSDFPGDSLLHTGTLHCCAGGVLGVPLPWKTSRETASRLLIRFYRGTATVSPLRKCLRVISVLAQDPNRRNNLASGQVINSLQREIESFRYPLRVFKLLIHNSLL